MADNGNDRQTIQCSRCRKRFFEDGFKVNRLGSRNKTCLECAVKKKNEPQARKPTRCEHDKYTRYACQECSPHLFCEHGKKRTSHECAICDPEGNQRRKYVRNANNFATQEGGWPFESIRTNENRDLYKQIVDKWTAVFARLLEDGVIDANYHAQIMANNRPYEGPTPPAPGGS